MSLRHFLNAAYALLVEGFLTVAPNRIDLLSAVEKVDDAWGSLTTKQEPKPENVQAQNEAAMAQLKGMLAGVKGSPV